MIVVTASAGECVHDVFSFHTHAEACAFVQGYNAGVLGSGTRMAAYPLNALPSLPMRELAYLEKLLEQHKEKRITT